MLPHLPFVSFVSIIINNGSPSFLDFFLFNFSVLPYPQTHMRVPWTPLEENWDHEFLFWPLGVDMTRTARFQFETNHVRFFHVITSFSFN